MITHSENNVIKKGQRRNKREGKGRKREGRKLKKKMKRTSNEKICTHF